MLYLSRELREVLGLSLVKVELSSDWLKDSLLAPNLLDQTTLFEHPLVQVFSGNPPVDVFWVAMGSLLAVGPYPQAL